MTDIDPLDAFSDSPSESVDTSVPKLKPGLYDLTVVSAEVGKTDRDTFKLSMKLKTTKDAQDREGGNLNAGFPIYHNVGLSPSENYDLARIEKNVASITKAAGLGNMSVKAFLKDPSQIVDKLVRCKVGISPEKDGYPEKNTISQFVEIK